MNSLRWGAILILFSIILGAFGAHYFSEILEPKRFNSLKTGINYQMYMGLALVALNGVSQRFQVSRFNLGIKLILIGTLIFSLSIFGLVYLGHSGISVGRSVLGPLTPLGGSLLIIGWIIILLSSKTSTKKHLNKG